MAAAMDSVSRGPSTQTSAQSSEDLRRVPLPRSSSRASLRLVTCWDTAVEWRSGGGRARSMRRAPSPSQRLDCSSPPKGSYS